MRGLLLGLVYFCSLPLILFYSVYVGILMWFWVSLMNPQKIVWSSIFSNFNYALIVAVLTLFCWLISRTEPKIPPRSKTTVLLLIFMVWISITSLFGLGPPDELSFWWSTTEKMLFMTLLAYTLTTSRQRLDQLIAVCALSVGFFGLRGGVGTLLTGGAFRVYGPDESMIGDNNDLGVALTMMIPILFYMWHRYREGYLRWPLLILIGLTIIGDLFTYSRGALVAIAAMSIMLWFRSRQKVFLSALVVVTCYGLWNFAPPEWFDRMNTIESYGEDNAASGRLYLWELSWQMALKRPIIGAGFHWSYDYGMVNREVVAGTDLPPLTKPRAAHSIWLQMMSDHGFVGFFLFLLIFGAAMLDAQWLVRQAKGRAHLSWADNLGRMLQASLVGFAVGGTFVSLAVFDGAYAIVIIAAAARHIVAREIADISASVAESHDSQPPGPAGQPGLKELALR
jgi:putative inorganic carbon (HCO3(-)) transporter